jgi:hypothetical protein
LDKYDYKDFEIYDAHSHIFPAKIARKATTVIGDFYKLPMYSEGSSEKLLKSGMEIGVKKYLVCSTATVPQQTESINSFIKAECDAHPEFFGFGTLHPDMDNIEAEVDRIISFGLHGIKIHPDFQKFDIDASEAYKIRGGLALPLEHVLQLDAEYLGDAERGLERGRILPGLDRRHGLARHPDLLGQFRLRHLPVLEPQAADLVGDRQALLRHVRFRAGTL